MHPMDGLFALPEAARTDFLRSLVQSFGCTYVCLWQFDSNLSNRLFFLGGFYDVTNNQSSSSLGSGAERLFHQYRALTFDVNDGCVPGFAFRNHLPCLELQQLDLLRLTSAEIQTQFFQEARIEIAVFMGCKNGEIELGFSRISQDDIQTAIASLFSEKFFMQPQSSNQDIPQYSSSSSSLLSLSTGSPDQCVPLLLSNIPQSHFSETLPSQTSPHQQQALAQVVPSYFPTPEGEHEAIVRALLQVISSTSQQHQSHQNLPNYASATTHQGDTVFKRYNRTTEISTPRVESNFGRQSLQNRSLEFFTNLNSKGMREGDIIQASLHISSQQHNHMITERRRREQLNQRFQALRALLPPGTKKSKETILTTAKETMKSLMDEIEMLNIRNQQLMMKVLSAKEATSSEENKGSSSNERLNVRVSDVLEPSSSEERMVDLQVTVRGESSQVDVLIRLLEFLERVQNVNLISMGANNHITGGIAINTPHHQLIFRLRIVEGSEWDQRVFQEAVRRVVADVIHCQLDEH